MNGTIGFESTEGQGSKFWISLPVSEEATVTRPDLSTPSPATTSDSRNAVLYIEDKILNVELMRGVIENAGHLRFFDAQTVKDGISIARAVKPDLIITDIHLPDGNGFDALQALRDDPSTIHIPVVALTADAMPTNMGNMNRAGFDYILTKPFKVADLMDILRLRLNAA
jgi:CheY-like chemotaxis protein